VTLASSTSLARWVVVAPVFGDSRGLFAVALRSVGTGSARFTALR
jgi:hypothetical protein